MERDVGGLRCLQVLERLDDFVAGTLDPATLAQMQAHVAGCGECARFGGRYAELVTALRALPPAPATAAKRRLLDRLYSD